MKVLNLPTYSLKIKSENDLEYVYDQFRKKYVRLTPEEWVRQNFAHYLVNEKSYPASRMMIEKALHINRMSKRCDIVVCNDSGDPVVMIECKAPGIKIGQSTFEQVSVYNIAFQVNYLIITNGMQHFCCKVDFETRSVNFLKEIPGYDKIRESDTHQL
jgi:hypothetical protein